MLSRIDGAKARIGSEAEARQHDEALRGERFVVESVTRSERRKSAPPPFTTSTLQQEASRKLGFGASRTMRAAQSLYEGIALAEGQVGLITYMRTDSVAIASGAVAEARQVINSRYGEAFVPKRPNTYRTRTRGAQEAHEAIRPSNFARTPDAVRNQLKPDEFRLYELIWKRALASQMAPARFDQVGVDVAALPVRDVGDTSEPPALDAPLTIVLGGHNGITHRTLAAAGALESWGLLTLDAHHDVRPYEPDRVGNGSPVRALVDAGLPGANVVQVVEGTMTFFQPSLHPPFPVLEDLAVTQTSSGQRLYNYWVNQFVCPWFRTFDEAVAANPLPLPFNGTWAAQDCTPAG